MANEKQIDTVRIGMFHFRFGDMNILQNALLSTKLNVMREQVVDDIWPVGDFIYFIHKLQVPFQLTYVKPTTVDESESKHLYTTEFLPLYAKCVKAGIIAKPDYTET